MARPLRTLGVAALVVAAAGCAGSTSTSASTTTTSVPVGTIQPPSPAPSATTATTATALPPAPQATPSAAADAFILGWQNGNRAYSASVATATAVSTLFAQPYAGQTTVSRGCTTAFPPYVCSYGPGGGGSGALYQVTLSQTGSAWYVSGVTIEG